MTGGTTMGEMRLDAYRSRVVAARDRLHAMPYEGTGTARLDPETGETWDRLSALGHIAEMLPLWTGQLRASLSDGTVIGRDTRLVKARQDAIDRAAQQGEQALRAEIDAGLAGLLVLIDDLDEPALDRAVTLISPSEDRETTAAHVLEARLIGHLEGHLDQLASMT
jgi:hypothetical protein